MSEEMFVRQCAPTLAGVKTGSLFSCPYDTREGMTEDVRRLNRVLVPKGLRLLPLRYSEKESAAVPVQTDGAVARPQRRQGG